MYDYVIVAADRRAACWRPGFSEMADAKVLLIEAGPRDRDPYIHMPVGFFKMTSGPLTWGYRDGALAPCQQPRRRLSAGPRARRRQFDQCRNLYARLPRGLRRMGGGIRLQGLELEGSQALFHQVGRQHPAGRQRAWGRRPARRFRSRQSQPRVACLCAGLHGFRHAVQFRFQFRQAGRRGPLSDDDPQRPPLQRRRRLSAAGEEAHQSHGQDPLSSSPAF